ncbi:MAG TPA: CbrC family protein [Blastocatellia bacterium]|nr:CbrC family protein [Blastocatellia bacterium]
MNLPVFKYHPDPLGTGSVEPRDARCVCCEESKQYIYTGPVHAVTDLAELICPWCIASGFAHQKYGAEFNDQTSVGDGDHFAREAVPKEVIEEIAYRTPGFTGWQQGRWLVHCGEACAFLGLAGRKEIEEYRSRDLLESLRRDIDMDEEEFRSYLYSLDKKGSPTAYIFRCLHCGKYLGYSDFD